MFRTTHSTLAVPLHLELYVNPLTSKSEEHLISPFHVTLESNIKATITKGMITN